MRTVRAALLSTALMVAASLGALAATPPKASCQKVELAGEVEAGREWKAALGQGWVFRVIPVDAGKTPRGVDPYSGWDLVVDREQPAGFPDALLLATPPYDSINQREIGTTFGVRSQDAIGWNPRSFRMLVTPQALREGQRLFADLHKNPAASATQMQQMAELLKGSAVGEFRVLEARITPGVADAAPFAENWAIQSAQTPHSVVAGAGGRSTALGSLDWMRFSITLWLPGSWQTPAGLHAEPGACAE